MSDSDESELDSDEENELQDLEQLHAAISELDNEQPCTSASLTEGSIPVASTSADFGLIPKFQAAVALNRMCDEKLRRIEGIMQTRLAQCRRRLAEIKAASEVPEKSDGQVKSTYANCGKPYFKDKQGFPAPDNEDTILMRKSGMYNFSSIAAVPGWTMKDKTSLTLIIHQMSKELKKNELNSQLSQLVRGSKSKANIKKIAELKKQIVKVNKEPLKTLALPIDEEYDWDYIAGQMSERHTAQEYRSLWKLYLHPSINKNIWAKWEHISLQKIAFEWRLQDWRGIAMELGTGRTCYQCFVYFRANMNNTFTNQKWTKEEEEYLLRLIEYYREENYIPWGKVAAAMENRTKVQIYNKYARLCEHRKGKFLPEEDSVILTCVDKYGRNFRKVTEYLQGRSITQCRERYNVLIKKQYSAVWTVAEDRKLIQLMANQDSSTNFSTVTKFFPGKDRVNIRSRYLTLCRWMRRNPYIDIKRAPRRGPRRLCHGKPSDDLKKAIENLKKRLENEVTVQKKTKVTRDSPDEVIDDAIVALVADLQSRQTEADQLEAFQAEQVPMEGENTDCDINVLRKLLILLKANLNKQKFANSPLRNKYPDLLDPEPGPSTVQIRSYSRKDSVKTLKLDNKVDIWGNTLKGPLSYVLPPNYETITGCKQLMAYNMKFKMGRQENKSTNVMIKRNLLVREQFNILMERFNFLFLWPMILASMSPEDCKVTIPKNMPSTSKSSKQFVPYERADYSLTLPVAPAVAPSKVRNSKKIKKIDEQNTIDVENSGDTHTIAMDETYFDSIEDNLKP